MPTWVGSIVCDIPRVLPDTRGVPYLIMRHYSPLCRGQNVYILADGTVTEHHPGDDSVVKTLFGAHENQTITEEEAGLLIGGGYTVVDENGSVLAIAGNTAVFDDGLGRWQAFAAGVSEELAVHPLTGSSCMKFTNVSGSNGHTGTWATQLTGDVLTTHGWYAVPITPSTTYEFRGSFYFPVLPAGEGMGLHLYTYTEAGEFVNLESVNGTASTTEVVTLTGTRAAGPTEALASLVTSTSGTLPEGESSYYDDFFLGTLV